jgi:Kef-type K+ transport system membrane component KefB
MRPIISLFVPIFFVAVGLSVNLSTIDWTSPFVWVLSSALLGVALLGKVISALLIRESWPTRLAVGVAMVPRGEVGLIFAELGHSANIFGNEVHAALIIVITVTTVAAPLLLKWCYHQFGSRLPAAPPGTGHAPSPPAPRAPGRRVPKRRSR